MFNIRLSMRILVFSAALRVYCRSFHPHSSIFKFAWQHPSDVNEENGCKTKGTEITNFIFIRFQAYSFHQCRRMWQHNRSGRILTAGKSTLNQNNSTYSVDTDQGLHDALLFISIVFWGKRHFSQRKYDQTFLLILLTMITHSAVQFLHSAILFMDAFNNT